jgi:hypothetical protein
LATAVEPAYVPKATVSEQLLSAGTTDAPAATDIGADADIDADSYGFCRRTYAYRTEEQGGGKAQ